MSRILIAWELGHGLGHLYPLRNLAGRILDQGHEVTVTARDLPRLHRVFEGSGCRILAAPFFPGIVIPPQQVNSLADVIWYESAGHSEQNFTSLFLAWRELISALGIDLLIADAAPVALAGASALVATLNYVHCFHATDARAWAVFRDWEPIDEAACAQRAGQLLDHLNRARRAAALAPVDTLPEGFAADRQLFRCLPELDHAGPREGVRYIGQLTHPGLVVEWPLAQATRRIFVYLRSDYEHLDRALGALQRLEDTAVLCFHNRIPDTQLKLAKHIHYSDQPFDLSRVLPEADAVLCHGGGVHALAAQLGKPAVLLPLFTEQFLSARAAAAAGIAVVESPLDERRPNVLAQIRRVLEEPGFADRALQVADAHRRREPDPARSLMEEVSALLP